MIFFYVCMSIMTIICLCLSAWSVWRHFSLLKIVPSALAFFLIIFYVADECESLYYYHYFILVWQRHKSYRFLQNKRQAVLEQAIDVDCMEATVVAALHSFSAAIAQIKESTEQLVHQGTEVNVMGMRCEGGYWSYGLHDFGAVKFLKKIGSV